jgi:hypothetical protein
MVSKKIRSLEENTDTAIYVNSKDKLFPGHWPRISQDDE